MTAFRELMFRSGRQYAEMRTKVYTLYTFGLRIERLVAGGFAKNKSEAIPRQRAHEVRAVFALSAGGGAREDLGIAQ